MSRGKYLSLEEARQQGKLAQFCKEHPTVADRDRFERLLDLMSRGALKGQETSKQDPSASSTGTRTRRGTSKGDGG